MSADTRQCYKVRDAAHVLGVHENTVRNMVDDGRLLAERLPSGHRRIPIVEVERLLRERAERTEGA